MTNAAARNDGRDLNHRWLGGEIGAHDVRPGDAMSASDEKFDAWCGAEREGYRETGGL